MKASELRIGNIIHDNDKDCPFQGEHDTTVTHEIIYHIACNDKHLYSPIPLTEEWLLKFGFNIREVSKHRFYSLGIDNNVYFYYNTLGNSGIVMDTVCENCDSDIEDIDILNKIESVHQLQNLYHALTGEELTLKS